MTKADRTEKTSDMHSAVTLNNGGESEDRHVRLRRTRDDRRHEQ